MTQWTHAARMNLENYFERVHSRLEASGADAAEVTDDIRRHIDEEIAATKLQVVTEEDVRRILARLGATELGFDPADVATPKPHPNGVVRNRPPGPISGAWLFFGVFLPLFTLGLELLTHMCAGVFFDPIPTVWHVILVALVPVANLLVWWVAKENKIEWRTGIGLANGFALGISFYYALLYLPLLPFALMGVLFLGFGLLPLAPLLAFVSALKLRFHLRQRMPTSGLKYLWGGIGLSATALALITLPVGLTRHWSHQAAATDDPDAQLRAIKLLRTFGHKETLLADCYGATRWNRESGIHFLGTPVNPEAARNTYFRVTGELFNSVPPPQLDYGRGGWNFLDEFTWDREQGGEAVGGRVKGLTLSQSRLDGLMDPDAAWSYVEWILEFKNAGLTAREARAQIALPPGGVVSRLTLWVEGEEREAAFAGRSQVREAYRHVAVVQKRDPVLVTSCGPDRVLMQCFPVPPDGGTIKVRLGITAPLVLDSLDTGIAKLPCFLERNFTVPQQFQHSVWVQSRTEVESPCGLLSRDASKQDSFAVHGQLKDLELGAPQTFLRARRSAAATQAWVTDHGHDDGGLIWQTIERKQGRRPGRVVLVVDATRNMEEFCSQIAASLNKMPEGMDVVALLAKDGVQELSGQGRADVQQPYRHLSSQLGHVTATGGHDNVPALVRAWNLAAEKPDGVVVWIHGPQPVLLENVETLKQRFEWRGGSIAAGGPMMYDLQTKAGPNRVAEKLDGFRAFVSMPRLGSIDEDLARLFGTWKAGTPSYELARSRAASTNVPVANLGKESSRHLARLWAYGEIQRLIAARQVNEAIRLAGSYQLVTAVSGAVVLESARQFQQAGLTPVESTSVPSVPEPKGLLALAVVIALGWRFLQRRWKMRVQS